ncbi:MAG: outer membrane beta-barrel protein [Chitinophagaceae bacterium]|nr:outer membrane beta-barrel protein [Chitinophagaceae bacterium]
MMAQTGEIRGVVVDTVENNRIENAVVAFLNPVDSSLTGFLRTGPNGAFKKELPAGQHLVLITCPTYADFVFKVDIQADQRLDLNLVYLLPRSKVLQEVIVSGRPIRIKGDTTEYMTDSFHLRANATVEDLLKELPGLQVTGDGRILAQGRTVKKILVDGEEFFSDDPTIVTKNLRAEDVKKVQIFDKKSDRAEVTGIDDGQRTKTINLELKDNARQGYFGTASAGALDKYYNFRAMINAFKEKRKLSAFGVASTTSETGLDWTIAGNYGFSSGNVETNEETGVIMVSEKNADEMGSGNFTGQGLPESIKAGLHYNNSWNNDRTKVNMTYLFNRLKTNTDYNEFSQNILRDSFYFNRESIDAGNLKMRHTLTGVFDFQLDSMTSLKITANGFTSESESVLDYHVRNFGQNEIKINESFRQQSYKGYDMGEALGGIFNKRFKRKGQSLTISLNESYSEGGYDLFILDTSEYYNIRTGNSLVKDSIHQKKISNSAFMNTSFNVTYTHPVSKNSILGFSAGMQYFDAKENLRNRNFNNLTNDYSDYIDSLSSNFRYEYLIRSGGITYRLNTNKVNFSLGGIAAITQFGQTNLSKDTSRRSDYFNIHPKASLSYRLSTSKNLSIEYKGTSIYPSLSQIQPLRDNSSPMTTTIGNPNLKPAYQHDFNILYNSFQMLNSIYFFLGGQVSLVNNEINMSYTMDPRGDKTIQYVNTDNNYTAGIYGAFNMQIPKSIWRFGTGPILWGYRYTNIINHEENVTLNYNLSWRFTLAARIPEKLELNFAAQPGYRLSKSSISEDITTKYGRFNFSVDGSYQLPGKIEIGSDFTGVMRQKTANFDTNNNLYLWNAYIEKRFLKDNGLALRFSFFDILDKNKGYDRFEMGEKVMEQSYLTFGQYGLIQLTYNFKNKGGAAPAPLDGIHL